MDDFDDDEIIEFDAGGADANYDYDSDASSEQPLRLVVHTDKGEGCNCPGDCVSHNGHLFKLFKDGKTWLEAKADCETRGGHLATSTNAEKDAFLSSIAEGRAAWIGGTDKEQEGVWKWVTGEDWDYSNWSTYQADNAGGREHYLQINFDNNGKWNDLPDDFCLYYICECDRKPYVSLNEEDISHERLDALLGGDKNGHYHITEYESEKLPALIDAFFPNGEDEPVFPAASSSGCPANCACHKGHKFKVFTNTKTWPEAKADCEARGGHLATSTSEDKNNFIAALAEEYGTNRRLWLGGTDEEQEGLWRWITGEDWDYTNWNDGEPNNAGGNEEALEINFGSHGKWNDLSKTAKLGYVCECENITQHEHLGGLLGGVENQHFHLTQDELDKLSKLLTAFFPNGEDNPVLPSSDNPKCPTDCVCHKGHKFKLFTNTKTWAEAKADCEARGGHLVTSTSKEKNDFLASITGKTSVWLGATDEETEGVWKWINGEKWDYTNWHCHVQPDNIGSKEHYLQFTWNGVGKWNDLPATSKLAYVCECENIIEHEHLEGLLGGSDEQHFHLTHDEFNKLLKLLSTVFPDDADEPVFPSGPSNPNNLQPDNPDLGPGGQLPDIEPPDWKIKPLPAKYYLYEDAGRMYYGISHSKHKPYTTTALLLSMKTTDKSTNTAVLLQTNDLVSWEAMKSISTTDNSYGGTFGDALYVDWNKNSTAKDNYRKFYVAYSPNNLKSISSRTCATGSSWVSTTTSGATSIVALDYSPELRIAIIVSADGTVSRMTDINMSASSVTINKIVDKPLPHCGLEHVNLGCAIWIEAIQCFCITGKEGTATSITGAAGTWSLHPNAPKDLRGLTFRDDIQGGCLLAWSGDDKLFYISKNGKDWVRYSQKAIPINSVLGVAYSPEYQIYCAVGNPGNTAYFSKDLKDWRASKVSNDDSIIAEDIIWMPSSQKFVLRPAHGELLYTFAPDDWSDS